MASTKASYMVLELTSQLIKIKDDRVMSCCEITLADFSKTIQTNICNKIPYPVISSYINLRQKKSRERPNSTQTTW